MTRLAAAVFGRGTRWIHLLAAACTVLVMASYAAPGSVMRTDAFAVVLVMICAADAALCGVWRLARTFVDQIREGR